ncbi:jg14546 [Pararge aegeria aegeria]|uniref:Jg14546 protein n=1 Tax=Pararge aegeria aegeria TaxID=348720 RepID=A0A8S4RDU7_9NEOP|nr:jg14546 [Pararge aegeria aegeria]
MTRKVIKANKLRATVRKHLLFETNIERERGALGRPRLDFVGHLKRKDGVWFYKDVEERAMDREHTKAQVLKLKKKINCSLVQ